MTSLERLKTKLIKATHKQKKVSCSWMKMYYKNFTLEDVLLGVKDNLDFTISVEDGKVMALRTETYHPAYDDYDYSNIFYWELGKPLDEQNIKLIQWLDTIIR